MGKHKHGHKKSRKEKDSTSTVSESEEVDISDQQVSDLSSMEDSPTSSDSSYQKKSSKHRSKKVESDSDDDTPRKREWMGDESEDDVAEESAEFEESHKAWIESVLKEPMSFTLTEPVVVGSILKSFVTYLVTMYPKKTTVRRRYSEFDAFCRLLLSRYPAMAINPLPPKQVVNNTSEETVSYRMQAISVWLNELAKNPYIRSDPSFLAFVTKDDFRFANEPELNSLSMHNPEVKKKKKRVVNEGFEKYQDLLRHTVCPENYENELIAYENKLQGMANSMESLKQYFQSLTSSQMAISQMVGTIASTLSLYKQVLNSHHYSVYQKPDLDQTNAISMNVLNVSVGAWNEWEIASQFVPWYGGQGICDLYDSLSIRIKGMQELCDRRSTLKAEYTDLWNQKGDILGDIKSNRRKGNHERASKASMNVEDLDIELALKKKYLKRFTKMMVCRELSTFVQQEMTVLLSTLSSYAAASVVTCQQLQQVWNDAGTKMCANFSAMVEQSQSNFSQLKERLIQERLQHWEKKDEENESKSESESEVSEISEESESSKSESESESEVSYESSEEEKPKKNKKSKKSKKGKSKSKKSKRKEESDESSSEIAL